MQLFVEILSLNSLVGVVRCLWFLLFDILDLITLKGFNCEKDFYYSVSSFRYGVFCAG